MPFPAPPPQFLTVAVHDASLNPTLCALCAGYEGGLWRVDALAEHVIEWLPEFCLSAEELGELRPGTAVRLLRKAARLVYQTDKYKLRGEFGELFLHIAVRQVHGSIPAISKIYWKDSANSTVKGFDAVHVVEIDERLELWLGEVKFYNEATSAIRDVAKEILDHIQIPYLKNEVALIANKLDKQSKHYDRLAKLLDPNASLDAVFDSACIPVLITYDSEVLAKHNKRTPEYLKEIAEEVQDLHSKMEKKLNELSITVRVHLFFIPLSVKKNLLKKLDQKLKGLQ